MDSLFSLLFGIIIIVSFIPTFIAIAKGHPQTVAIVIVNIFLGWTLIGWVVALVWACIKPQEKQQIIVSNPLPQTQNSAEEIEKLAALKDKGIITEEEFNKKKAQILGI